MRLDDLINKACKAFWTWRGTFGKTWRLKPQAIYWIYAMVVRPTVIYADTVWWPSELQRMACLAIAGAMRTTAVEVLIGLPPLHL
jgi:hypothetical protein